MRPLVISPGAKEEITTVIEHARKNPFSTDDLKKIIAGGSAPGDMEGFTVEIPFGFKVVYTVEQQNIGWCHHISISIDKPGYYPHEHAAWEIIGLFGIDFKYDQNNAFWVDEETQSLNFVIKIKEDNRLPL